MPLPRVGSKFFHRLRYASAYAEHTGARDMSRKHGYWGRAAEAKAWSSRARRRVAAVELMERRSEQSEPDTG